jgi:carbamoyltransferase
MKNILGISAGYHDAAVSLISPQGEILFAGHSERYSKNKNDADLHSALLDEIDFSAVDTIAYYETPWKKQLRQWYSGQGIEWNKFTTRRVLDQQLNFDDHYDELEYLDTIKLKSYNHHASHAAAGFQTSPYDRATVVVIDAIGEWDTISIWAAEYDQKGCARYKRMWRQTYPHSIGLFYSAITGRVGLRPLDEEYITMGMAAWGQPQWQHALRLSLVDDVEKLTFKQNLHTGVAGDFLPNATNEDLAASAQALVEQLIGSVMTRARDFGWSQNLVYMGGVALNCLANRRLGQWFENIWIMPNPGDAGSSLGAAALAYGKKLNWQDAYLGHNIPGDYPVDEVVLALLTSKIVGVASGRAEFGPRALGNRSLLADPRGLDIKDKVNEIKRRQQFRPFAPVILEEHVLDYFDMPRGFSDSGYMQIVGDCKRPDLYPAIVHVDGTSRIQTVPKNGSGIRKLLESWYARTGCPMLLNTSLNIRGEPMINDRKDADRFEQLYGIRVCS